MIALIAIRRTGPEPADVERHVVAPYHTEHDMRADMTAAERAGFQTTAYECEDPDVFRSTLGLPL
jgi:hypothetical protein